MKEIAAFWRSVWWYLCHPGAPAGASPHYPAPERRVVGAEEAAGLGLVADPFDIAHDSEAKRIVRVLMMGSGLNEYGATAIRDAYLAEATQGTVPVPRDALRGLVEVARQVAASEPYPDPVPARDALAALDDAGLLEQLREEDQ